MPIQPSKLTNAELVRYARHLALPAFGPASQQKLKEAKVLVVGAGGLGSPVLLYLAAAGVGNIGIVDFDIVDESNLQRQVLFGEGDLGIPKTEAARTRLEALNPHINIALHQTRLSSENALEIIQEYDIVADGSDNFPTRYLVNDACVLLNKPLVFGAVFQFEGQVSVFNYMDKHGHKGPNYRDLHPTPPLPETVPSCAEGGVLGVLPGIIGSMQASEVIKVITGIGAPLNGRLFHFDTLDFESRIFKIKARNDNPLTGSSPSISKLIDYEDFCGLKPASGIKEISSEELKDWQDRGEKIQLIDVREPEEYQLGNIGGELMPLSTIVENASLLSKEGKVVFHCQTGARSAKVIQQLQAQFNLPNLYNLSGGIIAYWASEKIKAM